MAEDMFRQGPLWVVLCLLGFNKVAVCFPSHSSLMENLLSVIDAVLKFKGSRLYKLTMGLSNFTASRWVGAKWAYRIVI